MVKIERGTIALSEHLNLSKVNDITLLGNKIYGTITAGHGWTITRNTFL